MSVIDDAIAALQDHVLACTTILVKKAPDHPIDSATMLPLSIAHIVSGQFQADNASTVRSLFHLSVDVHFQRMVIAETYRSIDKFIVEYIQRLGGDPTLGGAVDTIVFPVMFNITPTQWDNIETQMVSFDIQVKTLLSPT